MSLTPTMDDSHTPIGRIAVTILGTIGSFAAKDVNLWLSNAAALVSIIVGLLTAYVLIRKIRKGRE